MTTDESDTTETSEKSETKVPLTEEFQREVLSLMSKATKAECSFVRDCCMQREQELRDEEEDKTSTDDYDKVKNPD